MLNFARWMVLGPRSIFGNFRQSRMAEKSEQNTKTYIGAIPCGEKNEKKVGLAGASQYQSSFWGLVLAWLRIGEAYETRPHHLDAAKDCTGMHLRPNVGRSPSVCVRACGQLW